MRRLLALTALGVLLVAGVLVIASAQSKAAPTTDKLPTHWKQLGLSDDQKKEVFSIQGKYASQISELEAKVKELKEKQHQDLLKVLSEGQKKKLRDLSDPTLDKSSKSSSASSPPASSK